MTPTGSNKAELVARVEAFLHTSRVAVDGVTASPQGQKRDNASRQGLAIFQEAAETKDIHIIVAVEKAFNQTELDQFGDSPRMRNSLREAIKGMEVIEAHLIYLKDPEKYRFINETHTLSKNRKGDLPYDEARQAIRSHMTRLNNLDTSRMDEAEREILEQRKENIQTAEEAYIPLQKTALNIKDEAN